MCKGLPAGNDFGQMSHPQAEDWFCQAHVTFPNTGGWLLYIIMSSQRQPPILVDSKSVLIVFIIDGALFLFQLLFDLQFSSRGWLSVYYWRMSVCVCLYLSGVAVCVEVSFIGPHAHGYIGKHYWDNCSCFIRASVQMENALVEYSLLSYETLRKRLNHISTQECENHSMKITKCFVNNLCSFLREYWYCITSQKILIPSPPPLK